MYHEANTTYVHNIFSKIHDFVQEDENILGYTVTGRLEQKEFLPIRIEMIDYLKRG